MKTLAMLAAAAILGAAIPAAAAGIMRAETRVVSYTPSMTTARTHGRAYRGSCWTSSIASQRADAFRCMVRNEIFDPCFSSGPHNVVCPSPPDAVHGTFISMNKPLPPHMGPIHRNVWMMQLAGGINCSMGTGTLVSGFPFYCTKNLVCEAPAMRNGPIFVTCGTARNAVTVEQRSRYLAQVVYT
ncbi:MAG TPA: hypothetical protein VFA29_00265 [Candidatus Baltobacteraceae bacterium]|nr:hypothetical protein [Candidatus Baltobacteraceae bacterium]